MKLSFDLGLTSSPSLGKGGIIVPPTPRTVFEADPTLTGSDNNVDSNFRMVCTLEQDIGPFFRVVIKPGASNTLTSNHVGLGRWAGVEGVPNVSAPFIEALFNGQAGFTNATTEQVSDWMPSGSLAGQRAGTDVVFSYNTGPAGQASQAFVDGSTNVRGFYKPGGTSEWDQEEVTGFTDLGLLNFGVLRIETRGGFNLSNPASDYIPMSFDDPIFAGNTYTPHPITLAAGKTLKRRSIEEYAAALSASIICPSSNLIEIVAVSSREAVRFGGGDVTIRWAYLKAEGVGEDHADTLQAFAVGARNITLTLECVYIWAGTTAATAGFFAADDWGGRIVLENVIVHGGPWGLRFQSGPNGADILISLRNVYFVGPFGVDGGPFLFEDVNGGVHVIELWDNVRHATIVDGVLVPGDLIAEPPSTGQFLTGSDDELLLGSDGTSLLGRSA